MSNFVSEKDCGFQFFGLDFQKELWYVLCCKPTEETQHMAHISINDLYPGKGMWKKYSGILNAVMQELLSNGVPEGCDKRTWIELPTVKQTFLTAMQMAEQGDEVSELSDAASPFTIFERGGESYSGAQCARRASLAGREEVRK